MRESSDTRLRILYRAAFLSACVRSAHAAPVRSNEKRVFGIAFGWNVVVVPVMDDDVLVRVVCVAVVAVVVTEDVVTVVAVSVTVMVDSDVVVWVVVLEVALQLLQATGHVVCM